jgi:hypothetical protein
LPLHRIRDESKFNRSASSSRPVCFLSFTNVWRSRH